MTFWPYQGPAELSLPKSWAAAMAADAAVSDPCLAAAACLITALPWLCKADIFRAALSAEEIC